MIEIGHAMKVDSTIADLVRCFQHAVSNKIINLEGALWRRIDRLGTGFEGSLLMIEIRLPNQL